MIRQGSLNFESNKIDCYIYRALTNVTIITVTIDQIYRILEHYNYQGSCLALPCMLLNLNFIHCFEECGKPPFLLTLPVFKGLRT